MHWMLMPFRRYAEFSGRSRRKEFWMFQLLSLIVIAIVYGLMLSGADLDVLMAVAAGDGTALGAPYGPSFGALFWLGCILAVVWALASIIPSIALMVRRLHDRNMSGWYLLGLAVALVVLEYIPFVGPLVAFVLQIGFLVLMALPGTRGPNRYGPDPIEQVDTEVFA